MLVPLSVQGRTIHSSLGVRESFQEEVTNSSRIGKSQADGHGAENGYLDGPAWALETEPWTCALNLPFTSE